MQPGPGDVAEQLEKTHKPSTFKIILTFLMINEWKWDPDPGGRLKIYRPVSDGW